MESRFRRLVGQRREKTGLLIHELETHAVSYQSTSPQLQQPIFIYQSLSRNACEVEKLDEQDSLLVGLSYDSVVPGKAPVFVNKPQKGNGPIKLQTSRRLSSGELLATSQDTRRTLADIREGDYVIGRKQGREIHRKPPKVSTPLPEESTPSARYTITGRASSSRMNGATMQSSWSSPQSPLVNSQTPDTGSVTSYSTSLSMGPEVSASSPLKPRIDPYEIRNDSPFCPDNSAPVESLPGQNATISALWRAEYGRLIKLYGQDGVDRNVAHLDQQQRSRRPSHASTRASSKAPSIVLEPLPQPSYERKSTESKRSSATSGRCSSYRDDASDASSFTRASMASSYMASSSHTTQTSFGDFDPPTTREDIRKIIQEMRSTYLRALEAQPPTPTKPKSTKKKRRPKVLKSLVSKTHADAQLCEGDRQTWHGVDSVLDSFLEEQKKPRAISHPVESFAGLTPIENPEVGNTSLLRPELQRADSLTLGGLMGDFVPKSKSGSISTPVRQSKQEEVAQTIQPSEAQTTIPARTSGTNYEGVAKFLQPLDRVVAPATVAREKCVLLSRPSSSAATPAAPSKDNITTSSYGIPTRPPPLPITQTSLVNSL